MGEVVGGLKNFCVRPQWKPDWEWSLATKWRRILRARTPVIGPSEPKKQRHLHVTNRQLHFRRRGNLVFLLTSKINCITPDTEIRTKPYQKILGSLVRHSERTQNFILAKLGVSQLSMIYWQLISPEVNTRSSFQRKCLEASCTDKSRVPLTHWELFC